MHRLLDDQADADGGGQVVDDVALVDELADDRRREHGLDDEVEVRRDRGRCATFASRPGGDVVQRPDLAAVVEQQLGEMRADEAGAAGDQRLSRHTRRRVPRSAGEPGRVRPHGDVGYDQTAPFDPELGIQPPPVSDR